MRGSQSVRIFLSTIILGFSHLENCVAKPLDSHQLSANSANQETDTFSNGAFMEDCDWIGMTKDSVLSQKSVQQEYLRCASGRIKWLNPEGAVQIALHAPRNFNYLADSSDSPKASPKKLCLTFDPHSFRQVQLYLQKGHNLELIYSPSKISRQKEIRKCFDVESDVSRIFLEKSLIDLEEISPRSKRIRKSAHPRNLVRLPSFGASELLYSFE